MKVLRYILIILSLSGYYSAIGQGDGETTVSTEPIKKNATRKLKDKVKIKQPKQTPPQLRAEKIRMII